ncbi:MAG: DNA repair protein RecO [Desulfobacterales bacterium]|nr:DNA repair protein RecO [Desulfobacterales bacterium]
MANFSTDAILLRKTEYGDYDFIITFLTRDRGKLPVIAKNAKQSVRRFSGALDLFSANHIHCAFPKKNKDGLVIMTQSDLDNGFAAIRYDLWKTAYASYWVEMMTLWLEEGKPQTELYDLLYFSLDTLTRSDIRPEVVNLMYQIRFMGSSGFAPILDHCAHCEKELDDIHQNRLRFDFKEGRVICGQCRGHASRFGMEISKGTLKQLAWINGTEITRADRIKFSPMAIREGEILLESFIPFHIGREFRSLAFLNRLRQDR